MPLSDYDADQVIRRVYDEVNNRLRVDAQITASIGTIEVVIDHVNDSIKIGDGTNLVAVSPSGKMQVEDTTLNTTLSTLNAKFVDGTDIGDVTVNNGAGASAVNIQDGGNSITVDSPELTSINNKLVDGNDIGDVTVNNAGGVAAVNIQDGGNSITVDSPELTSINNKLVDGNDIGDVTVNNAGGSSAVNIQDGGNSITIDSPELTSIDSKLNTLGQKTSAGSVPVVLASDQSAIDISLDGFTGTDSILSVGTEDSLTTGTKHVLRVDSELDLRVGISDGANKAQVNASSELSVVDAGANTKLTSIDTNISDIEAILTDIEAGIPESLGQQTEANSMPVTIASDQPAIPNLIIGTEDGTETGTQRVYVNNLFNQILATENRIQSITYDDAGTKFQRQSQTDYTSTHFSGFTARKIIAYADAGTKYQRPITVTRSIV